MKYAIIEVGGKQYWVREGDEIVIEKLRGLEAGQTVAFERVLALRNGGSGLVIGRPYVPGAKVRTAIVAGLRGEKLTVFTYKPKKRSRRKLGHRQLYWKARVLEIQQP